MLPPKSLKKTLRVVEFGRRHNIDIDPDEARQFLHARKTLASCPGDVEAQRVMCHYEIVFYVAGRSPDDFSAFAQSLSCPAGCPECAGRHRRWATK